jgi:hypothetical protein
VWRMTDLADQPLVLDPAYRGEAFSSAVSRGGTSARASTKWLKPIDKDGPSAFPSRLAANSQSLLQTLVRDDPLIGKNVVLRTRVIYQQLNLE